MRLTNKTKNKLQTFLALILAFASAFGTIPINVLAAAVDNDPIAVVEEAEPFIARIDGEEVLVAADGIALVNVAGLDAPIEMVIPRYVYLDGEAIPVDDDRIENIAPVLMPSVPVTPFMELSAEEAEPVPAVGFIATFSGVLPTNPSIGLIGQEHTHPAYVTMNGRIVSSRRYTVIINGVSYEAYCADPNMPGPETNMAVYELTGADGSHFRTVLRYGFPVNPNLTENRTGDERAWYAYMTRVAVAYISRPNATWGRIDGYTRTAVDARLSGAGGAAAKAAMPPITINGHRSISVEGVQSQSPNFTIGHNRRTTCMRNPFRFYWAPGTPAGTGLYVNGNPIATAPVNSETIFSFQEGGDFTPITHFHLTMPAGSEGQTARVDLRGINNRYAGRVFVMQNPNDIENWQDMIFYVPEVLAHAAYTWDIEPSPTPSPSPSPSPTPTPTPTPTPNPTPTPQPPPESRPSVFIEKVDALSRENVPNATHPNSGALIRLIGMSSHTVALPDGSYWTFNNTGINLSQVLTANAQVAPPGLPGVTSTVGDGWWRLEGLPYGMYLVVEERAPDGFSLLPQHTAYAFWLNPPNISINIEEPPEGEEPEVMIPWDEFLELLSNMAGINIGDEMDLAAVLEAMADILGDLDLQVVLPPSMTNPNLDIQQDPNVNAVHVVFENYPFSEIVAYKHCIITNQPLAGAHIRIQGFFVEGNAPQVIDQTLVTDSNGRVIFRGLPAGQYTLSEVQPPSGFMLDDPAFRSVAVSWGQIAGHATRPAPVVRFYNTPMSYLEVLKIDGDTTGNSPTGGQPLAGARFRLTGLDAQGNRVSWYATSGANGIARFDGPFIPGETYILEEVQAPDGFVLMDGESTIIMTPKRNEVTWRNWRNPGLTIIKTDQDTGERLAGAEFTIQAQGSGTPLPTDFPLITGADGTIHVPWTLFAGESERTFIITEVVPPPGYHLANPNWQVVTMVAGYNNTVLFQNRRKPTITINKRDAVTGEVIEGAYFHIEKIDDPGRGPLTGNPFRTNANGQIVLPFQHAGMYRITEVRAAQNYFLDPLEQNRSWIIHVRPNEDYLLLVENTLLPTLVITKWNMITMRPVPLTHFRVEHEVPNSPNVVHIGDFVTDRNGQIILPFVNVGWYRVTEIFPAPGMSLNLNNNYRVFLNPGDNTYRLLNYIRGGSNSAPQVSNAGVGAVDTNPTPPPQNPPDLQLPQNVPNVPDFPFTPAQWEAMNYSARQQFLQSQISVTGGDQWLAPGGSNIFNWPLNSIVIKKTCSVTGRLLPGATFNLIHTSAGTSGTLGTVIGTYTTGPSGIIVITGLVPGSYVVREENPPQHFTLSVNNTQTAFLAPDGHTVVELNFANDPYGSLLITKRCEVTHRPLQHAEFRVTRSDGSVVGTSNGIFTTNAQGYILIPNLPPDSYVVTEMRSPDGFQIDRVPQTIRVNATGQTYQLNFTNVPYSSLIIRKFDSYNMTPLQGARFDVRFSNGEWIGEFITDSNGLIEIHDILGWVTITETDPPPGFALDPNPTRTVQVNPRAPTVVTFLNPRLGSLTIEKTDAHGAPLAGAQFRVSHQNGQLVGYHTTGASGMINIANLPSGWFFVEETRAPQGFVISEAGRSVEVGTNSVAHVTFVNLTEPTLSIVKVDENGSPLPGARFRVSEIGGAFREYVTTGQGGIASMTLPVGTFEIVEVQAPSGFVITEPARTFVAAAGEHRIETFVNHRIPALIIEKVCDNGEPLSGAEFEIRRLNGELVHRVVTGNSGVAIIAELAPGAYQIIETRPPEGFAIVEPSRAIEIVAGETRTERFVNPRLATFVINKIDGMTGQPLQGVIFEFSTLEGELIRNPVNGSFEFVTDSSGLIRLPMLPAGSYVATETRPLPGFKPATPVVFIVGHDRNYIITVRNYRFPDYNIRKLDGHTDLPMEGVQFEIATFFANGSIGERLRNPLDGSFVWTTDHAGLIRIPNLPHGTFVATETRTLPGFRLAEPIIFVVDDHEPTTLTVRNYRYSEWNIRKRSGDTGLPLASVVFEVAHFFGTGTTGDRLRNPLDGSFEFVTNAAGIVRIGALEPGTFIITETRPLAGYVAAEPVVFTVNSGASDTTITIYNYKMPTYVIRKLCGDTNRPLAGVMFEIAHYFGNGNAGQRIRNPQNGSFEFVTDVAGLIYIPSLPQGTFVAIETRALDGFILADPVVFVVGDNQNTTITIRNYRAPSLTIRKINSVTRQPIQGVVFEIASISGERIINPQTGFFDFVTDRNGLIHLPAMNDGTFFVTETRAAQGYFGLDEAVVLHINSQTRQQNYLLVIENTPASGLLIIKRDAHTGRPLQGVEFEVRHADGRLVRGQMADQNQPNTPANSPNIAPNGNFLTDHRGMIHLSHLAAGVYHITETRALPGYILDATVHVVTITPGRLTTLEVVNEQMAGLRLLKIDSVTRRGIPGVEFRIFDFITNQEVAGPFITDNNGVIDFTGILPAGRYTIRETREAPGYLRDTMPRTIELRAGMVTEIVWENTREAGQIQITKLSSADNQINGLPAGSRLEGAVFEVRDWRTGNVVDQFITNARGVGVSRPLPLGRYLIEEIVAPAFYRRSDVILDVTIEHSGQILRYEFFNEPANVGVEVRKTGPVEVMSGQPIVWNITTIANSSTIELSDFYVRDILPAHAVRLDRIFTGTFNQDLRYAVMFRTNLDDTWRVAYDNLRSTRNNALNMSPAALGLRSNEFVTEIMYSFGTVRAGFRAVEAPRIEGTVRDGLQNGYEFVNRVDIGGRTGSEWVVGNNVWVTRVFRPTHGQHPRTGW
ncbi:MAG: SpaA isopeptide-forming pilin-related protein [Defluviitaleaceae bacterium]|nr:SpaA isopeptide-forming pilin-related protein [Defluviitaleaceae bacterium]MCL2274216.1 SpaA isopeptide-forming pilin-related protein [Defluviitaleaceae bacterium]